MRQATVFFWTFTLSNMFQISSVSAKLFLSLFFFPPPKDINQSYDWNSTAKKNNAELIFSIT